MGQDEGTTSIQNQTAVQPPHPFPVTSDAARPYYANAAVISHSPYDFTLTFLRLDPLFSHAGMDPDAADMAADLVARVVVSEKVMFELTRAMLNHWDKYAADRPGLDQLGPQE